MYTHVRRDPFSDLKQLPFELNRFFNAFAPNACADEGLVTGKWTPRVDIHETENELVMEADLPGLKPGDFDISVENRVLTLKGERKFDKKTGEDNYHRVERHFGAFVRTFTLPASVNIDAVSGDFRDGVLRLTLPKKEEVKARQIQVKVTTDEETKTAAE
ncbi:MAG: Hsp20/alpha crystallin family protein [Blastocatellia bacterium]